VKVKINTWIRKKFIEAKINSKNSTKLPLLDLIDEKKAIVLP